MLYTPQVIQKTLDPVFNERFVFGTSYDLCDVESIVINVMDMESLGRSDMIGRVMRASTIRR